MGRITEKNIIMGWRVGDVFEKTAKPEYAQFPRLAVFAGEIQDAQTNTSQFAFTSVSRTESRDIGDVFTLNEMDAQSIYPRRPYVG